MRGDAYPSKSAWSNLSMVQNFSFGSALLIAVNDRDDISWISYIILQIGLSWSQGGDTGDRTGSRDPLGGGLAGFLLLPPD